MEENVAKNGNKERKSAIDGMEKKESKVWLMAWKRRNRNVWSMAWTMYRQD